MLNIILVSSAGGTTLPGWPPKPGNTEFSPEWLLLLLAIVLALGGYTAVRKLRSNRKGD